MLSKSVIKKLLKSKSWNTFKNSERFAVLNKHNLLADSNDYHRLFETGRNLWALFIPSHLLKVNQQVDWDHVQLDFECHQGQELYNNSG